MKFFEFTFDNGFKLELNEEVMKNTKTLKKTCETANKKTTNGKRKRISTTAR